MFTTPARSVRGELGRAPSSTGMSARTLNVRMNSMQI